MACPGAPPFHVRLIEAISSHQIWTKWLYDLWVCATTDTFSVPDSLTVVAGGTPVGTITDLQTLHDGNEYNLPEVSGSPGMDLECDFTGIGSIRGIVLNSRYTGSAVHEVVVRLKNYTGGDDVFIRMASTASDNYRTVLIPDDTNYISDGAAQISFYHAASGTPSHDLYIDYVALLQ